jgi:hypothetical protein
MSILDQDTKTISVGDIFNDMWIEEIWIGCHSGRCMAYYYAVDQNGTKLTFNHDEVMALLKVKVEEAA